MAHISQTKLGIR